MAFAGNSDAAYHYTAALASAAVAGHNYLVSAAAAYLAAAAGEVSDTAVGYLLFPHVSGSGVRLVLHPASLDILPFQMP